MEKRIATLILSGIVVLSLLGCGAKKDASSTSADTSKEDTQTSQTQTDAQEQADASKEAQAQNSLPKAGVYTAEYDDELGGVVYTFTNFLILNGDGTGTWSIQDAVPVTYDDHVITSEIATDTYSEAPYTIKDNSLLVDEGYGPVEYALFTEEVPNDVVAWLNEQTASVAHNQCAEPIFQDVDPAAPADGEYRISMKSFEACQASYGMIGDLYLVEQYDLDVMKSLTVGDTVSVNDEYLYIESIEQSGSLIIINGGIEEGGAEFLINEEDSTCRYSSFDDFPTFDCYGEFNLYVPEDCVITDSSDIINNPDGVVMTPDEFKKSMSDPSSYWYWNTSIVVKDNEIKEINIMYVP